MFLETYIQISRCQQHWNEKVYEHENLLSRILTIWSSPWRKAWGTLSICKAVVYTPGRLCCKLMTHLPSSLYFSFSICIESPCFQKLFTSHPQTMARLFPLSCSFFAQCFLFISSSWLQPSTTNTHNGWHCKSLLPLLAPTVTQQSWSLLAWDFPRAPVAGQVADQLRHVWWFSQVCHEGGVKNRNRLWKFTDSLKISWLLAKSENSQ